MGAAPGEFNALEREAFERDLSRKGQHDRSRNKVGVEDLSCNKDHDRAMHLQVRLARCRGRKFSSFDVHLYRRAYVPKC
jgi:hypothetical protein